MSSGELSFSIEDRKYYHHRPEGCTVVLLSREDWPGNEFGLWLPERALSWANWKGTDSIQRWEVQSDREAQWSYSEEGAELVSSLRLDPGNNVAWYAHEYTNTSERPLNDVTSQTCFHLVNAPELISIHGERIWACLDGRWITTDRVPRELSLDPNRVKFLRAGARDERTVVHIHSFPMSIMPQAASHPLIIAESFDGRKSVGIACRDMEWLFNNNDYILRCLHSEPGPAPTIPPGGTTRQEGVILFCDGDHGELLRTYESIVPDSW